MKKLTSLPIPLQKQILLRLALSAALLIFGVASAAIWRDKSMLLIIIIAAFCAVMGLRIAARDYIVISGFCCETDTTMLRRRTKAIVITAQLSGNEVKLRVPLRQQFKRIAVGETLDIYVDAAAQIHEWNGEFRLQSYIAVDKRSPK